MTIWPFRNSVALNTLDLGGDGDEMVMFENIERAFGIRFEQKDVGAFYTMGDLEALVASMRDEDQISDKIWDQLCEIARFHSAQTGHIDRNTTFFAKFAQPREIENG